MPTWQLKERESGGSRRKELTEPCADDDDPEARLLAELAEREPVVGDADRPQRRRLGTQADLSGQAGEGPKRQRCGSLVVVLVEGGCRDSRDVLEARACTTRGGSCWMPPRRATGRGGTGRAGRRRGRPRARRLCRARSSSTCGVAGRGPSWLERQWRARGAVRGSGEERGGAEAEQSLSRPSESCYQLARAAHSHRRSRCAEFSSDGRSPRPGSKRREGATGAGWGSATKAARGGEPRLPAERGTDVRCISRSSRACGSGRARGAAEPTAEGFTSLAQGALARQHSSPRFLSYAQSSRVLGALSLERKAPEEGAPAPTHRPLAPRPRPSRPRTTDRTIAPTSVQPASASVHPRAHHARRRPCAPAPPPSSSREGSRRSGSSVGSKTGRVGDKEGRSWRQRSREGRGGRREEGSSA